MDKRQLAEMIENGEEMMRMLENQLRWLRRIAAEMGVSLVPKEAPPMDAETSAVRDDMERMRQELMAKAAEDRRRIMDQARTAAAEARNKALGAGGLPMAGPGVPPMSMPGMPPMGMPGVPPQVPPAPPKGKGDDEQ